MKTSKRRLGDLGEYYAAMFLMKHGFDILERNYYQKEGEIDIIALKNNVLHFVEVKSVSRETLQKTFYRLEDRMNVKKILRIIKTAAVFIEENNLKDIKQQIDFISVEFFVGYTDPRIRYLENIEL